MSSLATILDAMADQVRAAMEATDVTVQVEPGMVINPTPPCIDIYPGDPSREQFAAGYEDLAGGLLVIVRARVKTADQEAGQQLLLAFMDDDDDLSVLRALMDDPTLNGHASDTRLDAMSGFQLFETPDGAGAHLGAQWGFTVLKAES